MIKIIELILLGLIIVVIIIDYKFPCDRRIKVILSIVVAIKIILIAYLFKRKGEEQETRQCQIELNKPNVDDAPHTTHAK